MTHGIFLSLDGIDGCGKSTQTELLVAWLRKQGQKVVACRDPGTTVLGNRLRDLVLHQPDVPLAPRAEALAYMAARAQLVAEVIRPALGQGDIVVSDRYLLANIVYQGYGLGLPLAELWRVGEFATEGLEPHCTFVLDIPEEVAAARRVSSGDRLESRGNEFFSRVRHGFLAEAERAPERIQVVPADAPADVVHELIRCLVSPWLELRASSGQTMSP